MESFKVCLSNKNLIIKYKNKEFIKVSDVAELVGYKKHNSLNLNDIMTMDIENNRCVLLDEAYELITTRYNKRNPKVINIHKEISFIGKYDKEAITLHPIINHLTEKDIDYELQYTIDEIDRRIDLFIPRFLSPTDRSEILQRCVVWPGRNLE